MCDKPRLDTVTSSLFPILVSGITTRGVTETPFYMQQLSRACWHELPRDLSTPVSLETAQAGNPN